MVDGARNNNKLNEQEKYLLALVTSSYEYLSEHTSEYRYKESLKKKFNECTPKIAELQRLCETLKSERKTSPKQKAWIVEVINRTYSFLLVLEIENKEDLSPDDFELRIKAIEECALDEVSMKYWFRYVRSVPSLHDVEERVKKGISRTKKARRTSAHAEFCK